MNNWVARWKGEVKKIKLNEAQNKNLFFLEKRKHENTHTIIMCDQEHTFRRFLLRMM